MNQCGRVPFPSVRILIFLRGAMSAISMMKLSSWPRSNLQGLEGRPRRVFFPCCFTASLHLHPVLQPWPRQQPQIKSLWVFFIGLELSCAAVASYCAVGKTPQCRSDRDSSFPWKTQPTWSCSRQPAAHTAVLFATRTIETRSQASVHRLLPGTYPLACPWLAPARRQNNFCHISFPWGAAQNFVSAMERGSCCSSAESGAGIEAQRPSLVSTGKLC